MKRLFAVFVFAAVALGVMAKGGVSELKSPDGKVIVTIECDGALRISASQDGVTVLSPSEIGINTGAGAVPLKVKKTENGSADRKITMPVYKRREVRDHYNEVRLTLSDGFRLDVRAYDDGIAYRFVNMQKSKQRTIKEEVARYNFAGDYQAFVPYVNDNRGGERYCYSYESYYDEQPLSKMFADSIATTPLAVCLPQGKKAVILETAVENYPGMFLKKGSGNQLVAEMAPVPAAVEIGGFSRLNLVPTRREDFIARVNPQQSLPWRIVAISREDKELAVTDIAMRLAPECRIKDTSWIKPGKVAWDWWNNTNLTSVDFRSGMNTPTYKYYIDFARDNHLEYIIIDEGWSGEESLMEMSSEIDLPKLLAYAKERGIGIILWSSWRNMLKDTEVVMSHYAAMGVKGFKIDFFDRDDQAVTASAFQLAEMAARHHLLLDYHGLKPTGVQCAYPNVVNFEGVKGLENAKWEPRVGNGPLHDFPRYDVTIPYLRMMPGPLDYTPGAMNNATRDNFFGNNNHPMSQGTRVHQMAMYVIYDAPLQMLADSPTNYKRNQECTDFISQIPTTFDETVALAGEMGEYVAIAKRKGNRWYVAAMNNWNACTVTLPLGELKGLGTRARVFRDGINADKDATDYRSENITLGDSNINVELAPAGGWVAIIE